MYKWLFILISMVLIIASIIGIVLIWTQKWEMTDCFGEYDYRQNIIHIQHDLCGQERANTIIHEIMHAAVQVSGLNQEKAALEKDEHEEAVVNQLTNVMMGVFRDNDWIVEMLKNDLNKTEHD